jgi:putative endonuclease
MPYYVYILHSHKTNHYYIGSAADPNERTIRHNAGATPSTKPGRPWEIVYTESFPSKTEALKREMHLKRMKSSIYLENLIKISNTGQEATSVG